MCIWTAIDMKGVAIGPELILVYEALMKLKTTNRKERDWKNG